MRVFAWYCGFCSWYFRWSFICDRHLGIFYSIWGPKIIDFGSEIAIWGSKMEARMRLWGPRVFFDIMRVRGVFFSSILRDFFELFWWFLESFLESFLMIFLGVDFCMKIVDFLRIDVLPKREHHFWRSGVDLEGLGDSQNRSKVVSERVKKER